MNNWQSYKQERDCLVQVSSYFSSVLARRAKVHETTTLLLVTVPNTHRFKKFTHTLSNKPFLNWLLKTPPHVKYAATLPCNLSLMACFADINVSQGSLATYVRCGEILDISLTANLLKNLPVKFFNRSRVDRIMVMSLWPRCFGPPCIYSTPA